MLIVVLVLWGYLTSSLPPPFPARHRTTSGTTAPATTSTGRLFAASINQPFTFGSIVYTVGNISRVDEVKQGTTSYKASGTFLLVTVTLKNQATGPVDFQPTDFSLLDSQGRIFSLHVSATRGAAASGSKTDLFDEALQPGLEREAVLVFDVPKQAQGLVLRISNGYLDVDLKQ